MRAACRRRRSRRRNAARSRGLSRDVVITMVSNDDSIREVFYGEDGILCSLDAGVTVIDSSTISPGLVKEIAASVGELGAYFLDAPVT